MFFLGFSIIASLFLYSQSISHEFVYDDEVYRSHERSISSLVSVFTEPTHKNAQMSGLYRPISTSLFLVSRMIFENSTLPIRLFVIVIHGVVSFLVYIVFTRLNISKKTSLISALLFLFLPIHTEAVANSKNGLEEVIGSFFLLLSFSMMSNFFKSNRVIQSIIVGSLVIVFFLLSILSKELLIFSAFIYPLFITKQRVQQKRTFILVIFGGLAIVGYLIVRILILSQYAIGNDYIEVAANPLKNSSLSTILSSAPSILTDYLTKTVTGINLTATYRLNYFQVQTNVFSSVKSLAGVVLLFVSLGLLTLRSARLRELRFGIIIFLVTYIPISQLFIQGGEVMAERWMYLPSIGIVLILATCIGFLLTKWKMVGILLLSGLSIWYGIHTYTRSKVWASNELLFQSMIQDAPQSIQGYYALAQEYVSKKQYSQAEEFVKQGVALDVPYPPFKNIQAILAFKNGDVGKAELLYKESLVLDPIRGETILGLGSVLYAQGRYEEALGYFNENLKRTRHPLPEHVLFVVAAYEKLNRSEDAKFILQQYSVPITHSATRYFFGPEPNNLPKSLKE